MNGSRDGDPVAAHGEGTALAWRAAADPEAWVDYLAICDCGGRLAGSASERRAADLLAARLAALPGATFRREPVDHLGWSCAAWSALRVGEEDRPLDSRALLRSVATPPGGIEAEVIDLGRGTPEAFAHHRAEIAGRIVLVRHEYMFMDGHIHRGRKYRAAMDAGAAGFLIASPWPATGPVAGSTGRESGPGIPGLGLSFEAARRLAPRPGGAAVRVRMAVDAAEAPARAENLIAEIPGRSEEWVVLSAHIDGHAPAESALDNATGLAVALAVARALAPAVPRLRRGLRICLFSVEEWALTGSRVHVARMDAAARGRVALDVNLDSVAGAPDLAALTSGYAGIEPLLAAAAADVGVPLRLFRPPMANSDHHNFAEAGIPAFRLVAGFDEPGSDLRHVLTGGDTRDKARPAELATAALLATAITARALAADPLPNDWRMRS